MGGSGGYFSPSYDPDTARSKLRDAESSGQDLAYEAKVSEELARALAQYNDRDSDVIIRVLDEIKAALADNIDGMVDLLFGGSIAKHTYVDGLSDVDALVVLGKEALAAMTPEQVRGEFADILRARYGSDAVYEGTLAVTVDIEGKSIQLLPALPGKAGLRIANKDATEWSHIKPQVFAKALTEANKRLGNGLIPTIKLAKGIIASLPEQRRLTGYHTETLAIRVFDGYDGPRTPKAMVQHFFENSGPHILSTIRDVTGQSAHVDDYLGTSNSVQRRVVADAMARIARIMKNADGARSPERWAELVSTDE